MTKLYTTSLYLKSDVDKHGFTLIDTTVKSGNVAFAPTWDIVMAHKRSRKGPDDDLAYVRIFYPLMRESYVEHRSEWDKVLCMDTVVLGCYCPAGAFCHRHLLVDMFLKIGKRRSLEVVYKGEIVRGGGIMLPP